MDYDNSLIKGSIDLIILKMLQNRSMYGYEIIRRVNDVTDGRFAWKEGSLYPALHRLEIDKLIVGEWQVKDGERPRRYYTLTRKGMKILVVKIHQWNEFSVTVNSILMA
ncbi:MAG: helix-turn-helix transcriptional regulator [Victivallaceae bacterium]